MKLSSIFFLIWSTCSLMSAKKECFFILQILNLVPIAFLSLNLLFSGFDTTRFQIFFVFLEICQLFKFSSQLITLLTVLISHY